jgi:hypothetical protein
MKHLKMLLGTAVAVVAAMALASPALATTPTSPAGTVYTGVLSGTSEGHVIWHTSFIRTECNGFMEGKIEVHGAGVTGKGQMTKWSYSNCTGNVTIFSLKTGTVEIHATGKGIGTITSSGTEGKAIFHAFGVECIYSTNNTDLGVVTDSSVTGGKATIDMSATIPRTGGSAFCGATATLTGTALVNTPSTIFID